MSSKDHPPTPSIVVPAPNSLVATPNTLVAPPPEGSQTVAALTPSARYTAGKDAMSKLAAGDAAGFDSLNQSAKDAFTAYGLLEAGDEREPAAKAAALDALRDAKRAGSFSTSPVPVNMIVESKDPAVRNQSPTGTQGESAGPGTAYTPLDVAAPAPVAVTSPVGPGSSEPNTTTPAVSGTKR